MGKALGEFVTVRYEEANEAAKAVIKKFNVQGFPTLLVLGPDGQEWDEIGAAEPADFVKDLARVRSGEGTLPARRAAVEKDPADAKAALKLANHLSNRYADEAVRICARLQSDAKDLDEEEKAELLFVQAYAESNRGGSEAALALFERAIVEFPKSEHAGHAAVFCGNVLLDVPAERGLAFIAKVLPLVGTEQRSDLEDMRGMIYMRAASDAWLRRGAQAGDDPELLNNIAWECFLHGWHTEQATQWARKAVELSNRAPHILDTLANLLFKSGEIAEAIRLEEEAMAKVEDPAMRAEFEESLATWNAVKVIREARTKR